MPVRYVEHDDRSEAQRRTDDAVRRVVEQGLPLSEAIPEAKGPLRSPAQQTPEGTE